MKFGISYDSKSRSATYFKLVAVLPLCASSFGVYSRTKRSRWALASTRITKYRVCVSLNFKEAVLRHRLRH